MDDGDGFVAIEKSVEFKVSAPSKHYVNLDEYNDIGMTSLMNYAQQGNLTVVKRLVENKANLNILSACEPNYTALMYAVEKGHSEVVEFLLQCNAKINIKNKEGTTARKLIKDNTIRERFHEHDQYFLNAVIQHKVEVVKECVESSDQNGLDALSAIGGKTALILATEQGDLDIVRILTQAKVNLNIISYGGAGYTALMDAAKNGDDVIQYQIAQKLIAAEADVQIKNSVNETALSLAEKHGKSSAIYKLINKYFLESSPQTMGATLNYLTSFVPAFVYSRQDNKNIVEDTKPKNTLSRSPKASFNQ